MRKLTDEEIARIDAVKDVIRQHNNIHDTMLDHLGEELGIAEAEGMDWLEDYVFNFPEEALLELRHKEYIEKDLPSDNKSSAQ